MTYISLLSNLLESITFDAALRKWFKKPADFRVETEGSEALHAPSNLYLEEVHDEDAPLELSTLVVTEEDEEDLPTGYRSVFILTYERPPDHCL